MGFPILVWWHLYIESGLLSHTEITWDRVKVSHLNDLWLILDRLYWLPTYFFEYKMLFVFVHWPLLTNYSGCMRSLIFNGCRVSVLTIFQYQKTNKSHDIQGTVATLMMFAVWETWWRYQMEIFSALLAFCDGIHRWIPLKKSSYAELWCFFYLRLNKPLQWRHNGHDGVLNHQLHDYSTIYSGAD